jgi:hypothetical protein
VSAATWPVRSIESAPLIEIIFRLRAMMEGSLMHSTGRKRARSWPSSQSYSSRVAAAKVQAEKPS